MPILYSVISRGTTVLAKFAECVGNFAEVTEQIISKISLKNEKLTYSHGNYLIHYNCENKIIYMCITDDEFDRTRAFLFLGDIKQKFIQTYGLTVATAIAYAMNSEFSKVLAEQMVFFSQSREVDAISRVHGQIDEIKHIMVKNIGKFGKCLYPSKLESRLWWEICIYVPNPFSVNKIIHTTAKGIKFLGNCIAVAIDWHTVHQHKNSVVRNSSFIVIVSIMMA